MLACELCGEPLIKVYDDTFMCRGCGCYYTKEEAKKLIGKSGSSPLSTSTDFRIVAGVLQEYTGTSTDIIIPTGVLSMNGLMFANSGITSLYIPDGVVIETLDHYHTKRLNLCGARWLKSIRLPAGSNYSCVFWDCTSLTEIDIPEGVTDVSFKGCTSLQRVRLPASLKEISTNAFNNCTSLVSINLSGVEYIGDSAFADCKSLTSVDLSHAKKIKRCAFSRCTSLRNVKLPRVIHNADNQQVKPYQLAREFNGSPYGSMLLKEANAKWAEEKAARERDQRQAYRAQQRCQHCGGTFKGLFTLTCSQCGKVKDY